MHRKCNLGKFLTLLVVFSVFFHAGKINSEESKRLTGKWLLVGTLPKTPVGEDSILGLIELKDEAGNLKAEWKMNGIKPFKGSTVSEIKRTGELLEFKVVGPVPLDLVFLGADKKTNLLVGAFKLNSNWFPATLSTAKDGNIPVLDEELNFLTKGSDIIRELMEKTAFADKLALGEKVLKLFPSSPASIKAGTLVSEYALKDAELDDVKKAVAFQERSLAGFPDVLVRRNLIPTLGAMGRKKVYIEGALIVLAKVRGDLSAPSEENLALNKLEASLIESVDKNKAADLRLAIDKQESVLDQIFLKTSIPFKPIAFEGHKRNSKRIALVELFTGAQCPPCVAADLAFDALIDSFKSTEVVLIQYHLHIPGPDPLTNPTSEARGKFYGVRGTPSVFINGQEGPALGGYKVHAEDRYTKLREILEKELAKDGDTKLELAYAKKGEGFELTAKYSQVLDSSSVVLRFCIIEDLVRYQGRNGQRMHHHVARGFPGGLNGQAVERPNGSLKAFLSLGELKAQLTEYLETSNITRPYPDSERPLDLKKIKAVAILQNAQSKEILQAVEVELNDLMKPK